MRVLFVNRMLGIAWGGGETFDYNMAKTLALMGNEVTILTGRLLLGKKSNQIIENIKNIKIEYVFSPYLRGFCYKISKIPKLPILFMLIDLLFFSIVAFRWIKKRKGEFEIIEILNIPTLAKWIVDKINKPVVIRFPGPPSERWEINIYRKIKNKNLIKFFAAGDAFFYLKNKGIDIREISQGIEFEKFSKRNDIRDVVRNKLNIGEEEILLISCGRLIGGKGFEFLIDGFKKAIGSCNKLRLLICGDGALRNKLEKKVANNLLNDKVIFAGRIKYEDLSYYLSVADIFLLLSFYENFSNAVLEAMACELPVITTNVGGFPLQIEDGKNGFLVKYGDIETLSNKILYLANNSEARKIMGQANRKKIIENYSWQKAGEKVLELYKELLKNK